MSTSPSADISITFVCRLVFIFLFVFILFALCIRTTDSVRLTVIANLCLIFDSYCDANILFVFVSVSILVLVLVQIFVLMH